jgi:hypothetical protein
LKKEEILQSLLDDLGRGTYLEIGVRRGASFGGISARSKIGVDPRLSLSRRGRFRRFLRQDLLRLPGERLFEMTSDDFFARLDHLVPGLRLDVALVDGLHTYAQSLRDVEHCLDRLAEGGAVVLHDCNPETEAMGYPAGSLAEVVAARPPGWAGQWTGDVWKTIVHLRALRADLHVFTLDCDFGVGVVTRGTPESRLDLREADLARLTYADLDARRTEFLNLKPPSHLETFRAARPRPGPGPGPGPGRAPARH